MTKILRTSRIFDTQILFPKVSWNTADERTSLVWRNYWIWLQNHNIEKLHECKLWEIRLHRSRWATHKWGPKRKNQRIMKNKSVVWLTSISPESTSRRERRLCPSRRSSNRSRQLRPAWGCAMLIYLSQHLKSIFSLQVLAKRTKFRIWSRNKFGRSKRCLPSPVFASKSKIWLEQRTRVKTWGVGWSATNCALFRNLRRHWVVIILTLGMEHSL